MGVGRNHRSGDGRGRARRPATKPMATNDTSTIGEKVAENMAAAIGHVLGVDAEGDIHVHRPAAERVEVFDLDGEYEIGDRINGTPKLTQRLDGQAVGSWVRYVEHERGWDRTTRHAEGAL